jgi:hypothetical protein
VISSSSDRRVGYDHFEETPVPPDKGRAFVAMHHAPGKAGDEKRSRHADANQPLRPASAIRWLMASIPAI